MERPENTAHAGPSRRRMSSGDTGLDRVLGGGLLRGAVTIFQGTPGAGKTTLANQMAFENARSGGKSLYITLLSESHGRMTAALGPMRFYEDAHVGTRVHYISGYNVLVDEGARALLELIATEARRLGTDLVVLDGLFVLGDAGLTESEYRKFVNDLALQAELMGASVLLLTNSRRAPDSPEYTMVDGWLELGLDSAGQRVSRFIEVHKLRGSGFVMGRHRLRISGEGIEVFPRLESHLGHQPRLPGEGVRVGTGIPALETMLGGGLPAYSNTLLRGPTGVGKTTFGLQFLDTCTPQSPGLLYTFYESPEECIRNARLRGIDLQARVDDGSVEIGWHAPVEHSLDELGHTLLERVRSRGIRALVIDGIEAFEKVAIEPERLGRFLAALTYELRTAGCTSVFISESLEIFASEPSPVPANRSAIGQNILLLRYAQRGEHLLRTLAILKVRESDFDARARAFRITPAGIEIDGPFDPRSVVVVEQSRVGTGV